VPIPETELEEFEPPNGGWTRCDFERANHESAHALAAHVLDLRIYEVRIDRPLDRNRRGPDPLGYCSTEKLTGEDRWNMLVSLAPLIVEGKAPKRPPALNDASHGDEFNAAVVIYEEEIHEALYWGYVALLEWLLRTRTVRKKGVALSSALLEHGALPGSEVERIFEAEAAVTPQVS
jgi:hypothetical protein